MISLKPPDLKRLETRHQRGVVWRRNSEHEQRIADCLFEPHLQSRPGGFTRLVCNRARMRYYDDVQSRLAEPFADRAADRMDRTDPIDLLSNGADARDAVVIKAVAKQRRICIQLALRLAGGEEGVERIGA